LEGGAASCHVMSMGVISSQNRQLVCSEVMVNMDSCLASILGIIQWKLSFAIMWHD